MAEAVEVAGGVVACARARARLEGNSAVSHRRTDDVSVETVLTTVKQVLAKTKKPAI